MTSFRVGTKIFATLPEPGTVRIMATPDEIRAAVGAHPESCAPYSWGRRLACVEIRLDKAHAALVRELLADAWDRKAPRQLKDRAASGNR